MVRAVNWLVLAYVVAERVAVAALLAVPWARWQGQQAELASRYQVRLAVLEYFRKGA